RVFELTGGQPWLVNALARQLVRVIVPDRRQSVAMADVETAAEQLIQRRDTHLDSHVKRLREQRVQRVMDAVLSGESFNQDVLDDDVSFVKDLGLVRSGAEGLEISNPIYREIIPRALTAMMEETLSLPRPSYVDEHGVLDFKQLLADFRAFWIENAEMYLQRAPYSEAAAHLVFMAFLHKITNGKGGYVDREYAAGRGRLDLCVRWPTPSGEVLRWAVELKVWRDRTRVNPVTKGRQQLARYLTRLGLDEGTLVVFDSRSDAGPLPDRCTEEELVEQGKRITVMLL
ncbi:MAG: ATP-binding protein, partial [bacterium]|nr:ATP-binding protein [bacterium]